VLTLPINSKNLRFLQTGKSYRNIRAASKDLYGSFRIYKINVWAKFHHQLDESKLSLILMRISTKFNLNWISYFLNSNLCLKETLSKPKSHPYYIQLKNQNNWKKSKKRELWPMILAWIMWRPQKRKLTIFSVDKRPLS